MIEKVKIPELLSPAGNLEKLRAALYFGADAVYLAGKSFGMRAAAGNFTENEMQTGIEEAHSKGKKCFVAVNSMPRSDEFQALERYLHQLKELQPDALITADLGVFSLCRKILPEIPIHISTQAGNVNLESCRMWYELGAKRVVLARELTLSEIAEICAKKPKELEIEVFIHGAMCVSFSGRCLLSEYYTGRDANRGACTQPCRWTYRFHEEKRPDDVLSCEIHPEGSYIFGSKDLCMIEGVRDLIDAGIDSFKIEGRMKSAYYAAVVTNAYRIALDAAFSGKQIDIGLLKRELNSVSHREYDTGFFYQKPMEESKIAADPGYIGEKSYLAAVLSYDEKTRTARCIQRNKFSCGDIVEVITPGKTGTRMIAEEMKDECGADIDSCSHPQMIFDLKIPFPVHQGDLIRKSLN